MDDKFSILIIEDNQPFAQWLRATLVPDYAVAIASTFAAGVEALEAAAFDAILLDLTLPDTPSPKETMKRFFDKAPTAAVIISTNFADSNMLQVAAEYGSLGYIIKTNLTGVAGESLLHNHVLMAIRMKRAQERHQEQLREIAQEVYALWREILTNIYQLGDKFSKASTRLHDSIIPPPSREKIDELLGRVRDQE